jgi:tRNA modification GTPase
MRDTIFAVATPPGRSGVAVIRLSGPGAGAAAERLCGPLPPARLATLRRLRDAGGAVIDEALVLSFPAPASFTGEDVVELQCHGSRAVTRALLDALAAIPGLRIAEAGEFTRRALIAGKMTVSEVEGLGDLLDAETERQRRQSFSLFDGAVADRVEGWRRRLLTATALCETVIDFGEEDVPDDIVDRLAVLLDELSAEFARAVTEVRAGQGVRDGYIVAVVGLPNAGKSSFINYLAGRDLALVSEVAGTTRDVIELRYDLRGLLVTFLDTAGLRGSDDTVEKAGIERALARAADADLRLFLSAPQDVPQVGRMPEDLVLRAFADRGDGDFSSFDGTGIEDVLSRVHSVLDARADRAAIFCRDRHRQHIDDANATITRARRNLALGQIDLLGEDLRQASHSLDELVGRIGAEDVLDEVFSSFCIGK